MAQHLFIPFLLVLGWLDKAEPLQKNNDHNWDILIFTQHWPATVCKIWTENQPSHSCSMPSKQDYWTIHGIWPTKFGTMGPAFCNKTWLFDPKQVEPIETDLIQSWTNIEAETSTYSLWAHEWSKHGTCAAVLQSFNNELKYFSKGIEWLNIYNMKNLLDSAKIKPDDVKKYQVADFHNAIMNKLGVIPMIECRKDKGEQYLFELRICFKKDLTLTDCFTNKSVDTNCVLSEGILYPHSADQPKREYVQIYKFITWLQWLTL